MQFYDDISEDKKKLGFVGAVIFDMDDIWDDIETFLRYKKAFETKEIIRIKGKYYKLGFVDISSTILLGLLPVLIEKGSIAPELKIEKKKYKCPTCGWIGYEDDMEADYESIPSEEYWSNWICPKCETWHRLEDYIKVKEI